MNSKRLLAIASLIEKEDSIVDIGCDHAYLDIYLIQNKLCKKAIAADISEGAINQARDNIKKYNLDRKIKTVLSDGLNNIKINELNTIVISGMGSNTILKILNKQKFDNIKKIIIQSNNNLSLLRNVMIRKGFLIKKEIAVFENNKYYDIILFVPGKMHLTLPEKIVGVFNEENHFYYNYLFSQNLDILHKLPKKNIVKRFKTIVKLLIIKKYLKDSL